jgi:hypothetical protein
MSFGLVQILVDILKLRYILIVNPRFVQFVFSLVRSLLVEIYPRRKGILLTVVNLVKIAVCNPSWLYLRCKSHRDQSGLQSECFYLGSFRTKQNSPEHLQSA